MINWCFFNWSSDLARNQLIGEIPRLIYWNEVLQYLWVHSFGVWRSFLSCEIYNVSVPSVLQWIKRQLVDRNTVPWYVPVDRLVVFVCALLYFLHNVLSSAWCYISIIILTSQVSYYFSDVRGNNLSGTIPDNIGNCTSFEILSVSFPCPYYVILKFFSYCFSMLTKLFFLNFRDISYNQITGEIPYNIGFLQVATLLVNFA